MNVLSINQKWTRQRQAKLDRRVQAIGWLLLAGSFISSILSGAPLWILICLCFTPWIALALVLFGRGRFRLVGPDGKTVFNTVFMVPCGVMVGSILRYNVIDWENLLVAACLGGTLFSVACFFAARATTDKATVASRGLKEPVRTAILALFVWAAGAGLVWATSVYINGLKELMPIEKMIGKVTRKDISGGRSHAYYLYLSGEATKLGMSAFETSKYRYERTQIGQTVCISLHKGIIGVRYYYVADC